jgi:pyrroloquinoline-quinone synthase
MAQEMMTEDAFVAALREARTPAHSGGHPFSKAWKEGRLTRSQLGDWATQQYYYIENVSQMFAALFIRMPDLDARQLVLENLTGEEDENGRHPDILLKFAKACGRDPEMVKTAWLRGEVYPGTMAMRAWTWELATVRELSEAAAGIMIALEGQTPQVYPAYIEAGRAMGFSDDDLEFFHIHTEADIEHEAHGLKICYRYATTPELQTRAIATVKCSARMRYQMLSDLWNSFAMDQAAE